jgi:hypothetical protein
MVLQYDNMKIFTLEDFNQIIFEGFSYDLPENTKHSICQLVKEIESFAPISQITNTVDERSKKPPAYFNKKQRGRRNDPAEEWAGSRSFKTTVIEKKQGSEKIINDIRACLNKISAKNYSNQKEEIISLVSALISDEPDGLQQYPPGIQENYNSFSSRNPITEKGKEFEYPEGAGGGKGEPGVPPNGLQRIATAIYDIAGTNKFNSDTYARLYSDLNVSYPLLKNYFDDFVASYHDSISQMFYADPNTDYDKYCEYNKTNDKRKAITTFLCNLVLIDFIPQDIILHLIIKLQGIVSEYIDTENKTNEVDEITENIYIFVTMLYVNLRSHSLWQQVSDCLTVCAKLKSKERKSLSTRAAFKYMDILDFLVK